MQIPSNDPQANQLDHLQQQNNQNVEIGPQNNENQQIRSRWHEFVDEQQDQEQLNDQNDEQDIPLVDEKEKSLKEKLQQIQTDNQETLMKSIRLRYIFRIILLLIITLGLLKIFWIIKDDFAFYSGFVELKDNINLNVQNCRIVIQDKEYSHIQKKYEQFLIDELEQTDKDEQKQPNILLQYYIPGRFNIDPFATVSTINVAENNSSFINILSSQNCVIKIFIFEKVLISNMNLNCSKSCYIIQKSENITYQDININGDLIESNFNNLVANNINYQSTQGRFQGNKVTFTNFSNINIESGDIIVQTDQEVQLNWTHAIPNYCLSAPVVANPIVIGCQMPKVQDIKKYLTGIGAQSKEDQKIKNNDETSEEAEEESAGEEDAGEEEEGEGDEQLQTKKSHKQYKKFFEDNDGDPNILIFDQLPNYEQTIDYQNVQKKIQQELEKKTRKKIGKFINLNIHLKKVKHNQEAQLFNPSCYGSILLCQSEGCLNIKNEYSKKKLHLKRKNQNKRKSRILELLGYDEDSNEKKDEAVEKEEEASEEENDTQGEEEETQNNSDSQDKKKSKDNDQESYDSQARRMLPHQITEGIPFLNLTGRFGNIYVNIINQSVIVNDEQTVVYGSAYNTQDINFSLPSIKKIYDAHKDSQNPHNFDPSFIFGIGSKQSQSDNFQQWQLTFNPAYSYLRPWWIGTFSFTLLSTSTYPLDLQLSPGFCPYVPTVDIRHLYQTGYLINGYFPEAEHSINTYSIQDGLEMPIKLNQSTNGFKQYIGNNNVEEKWYQISKINETNYKILSIDLNQSPATEWAVKVSVLLSMITALILLIGLIYIVIQVYDAIVIQVESIKKYGDIEQKDQDLNQKQPLMEIKQENQQESIEDKENANQNVAFTFNPLKMIYFLLVKAPPLSAFIDYLFILITKKFRNSAEEFYSHLFQEKDPKQDSDDVEQMLSIEFKTLYEKFCYLNGFLEQKLDDSGNKEYLKKYGFCINEHLGAQTECNVRVLFDKMVKLTEIPSNKTSYQLFIEKCCRLTNFEQDCLTLQTFNEKYDEFCITNHLKREIISNIQLKEYNIETKFIPLQYVERINKVEQKNENTDEEEVKWYEKCYNSFSTLFGRFKPEKKIYVINKQKLENHFFLIMDNLQMIKTREELLIANREIILYPGWFIWDFFTVLFHFFTTIVLIIPLFSFTILEKILYYPYSLIPINDLISQEDIFHNIWLIPDKLQKESAWIRNILILVIIYWVYSIIDLIYYYFNMEFPQEKFFSKTQKVQTNRLQFIFRQIMWILVLYSAYQLFLFVSLAGVWLVLGGIVNPSAFLPYATAAATFITVVISKATQYKEIAEEGFHAVIEYVEQLSNDQFAGLLKKYDIKKKVNKILDNQAVGLLADAAAGMGLVDQDIIQHIKQGVDQATKVNKKGGKRKLKKLQEDPQGFFDDLKSQMESKAKNIITTQISKQINIYGDLAAQLIVAMTEENLEDVQNILISIFSTASDQPNAIQFESLNGRTLPLVYQLAETFAKSENNNDSFIQPLIQNISECLSSIILTTIKSDKLELDIDRENLEQSILKSFQIESNLQQFNTQQIYNNFLEILSQQGSNQLQFQRLLKFSGILQLTVTLFEGKRESVPFHLIMKQIQTYFLSQSEFKEMKNILGYFDLILNSFKKQLPLTSTKQTIDKIESFYQFSIQKFKQHKDQITIQKIEANDNVSLILLWFNFVSNNFEKVPNHIIQEYITLLASKTDNKFLQHFLQVQGETNQFIGLFQNMLNMMTLFMDRPSETKKIYQQSQTSFQIDSDKTKTLIYFLQFSTKIRLTQENSQKENDLITQFSDTSIFQLIQTKLRISKQLLLGITMLLLNKFKRPEFQFLLDSISSIQKIDVKRIRQFFSIVIIYLSDDEQYLADAVENLNFPKEFFYFMLNVKKIDTIPYFYDVLSKLGFTEIQIQEMKDCYNDETRFQIFRKSFNQNLDQCYQDQDQSSNIMQMNLLYSFYSLRNQQESLDLQVRLESLSNNENQFLLLTNQEINLAKQIVKLGGLKFEPSSEQLILLQKQSTQELSAILNVNKDLLEDYVNLLFINNTNQTVKILKNFQVTEEIITISKEQQYYQFINYISSKTLLLNTKQEKIKQSINRIIPQGLPFSLINKILINKYQSIDIATFYKCTKLIIPSIQDPELAYEYINKLSPIVKFMTNAIQLTETQQIREFFNKNDLSEGVCNLFKILSEINLTNQFQQLINHLQLNQIQNQFDKVNNVPQFFLTHLCLYLFFRGKHQQLQLDYQHLSRINEQKNVILKVNILEFMNLKYNIAPEFFQSIHAIFLSDKQQFIQVIVRFNRKYQQLKIMDESQTKQVVPLQSLFKVSDTLIINLLNLLDGDFQPNFFAKQLKINKQLLDFIAALSKIKINQDNLSYRRIQINYLQKSYQLAFDKLQLDSEEFILIVQLLYQDLSSSQVNQLIQLFGLESKINQSTLLNLMHIDKPFPLEQGRQECLKQMNFGSNNLIDQMGLNKDLISTSKILINGATSLLDKVFGYYPQFSPKATQQYLEIVKSLVSCISGQMNDSNLNVKEFQKFANKSISDSTYKPEFVKDTFNGQEYAIIMFNKYFMVSAEYILLLNGQESFWKMIKTAFSGTYQEQVAFVHPLIVLEQFLVFYNIPLVMKKIITDYEYQKYLKRVNKEFNKEEKLKKSDSRVTRTEYKKIIFSIYQDQLNYEDLWVLLKKININLDNLQNYGDEKVFKKYQNRSIFRAISDINQFVKHTPLEEQFKFLKEQVENKKYQYRDIIYEELIDLIMVDRSEEIKQQMKDMRPYLIFCYHKLSIYWFMNTIQLENQKYEANEDFKQKANSQIISNYNNYLHLLFFTELFSLRNIYNNQNDILPTKAEDLQKMVILKLDYILSYMERFFFFQEFVDFVSKNSLIQLLGLSAGFVLTTEDIIKAKLTEQLFDYKFSQQYQQLKSSAPNKQILYKFNFMLQVYLNQDSQLYSRKKTQYKYNKISNQTERLMLHPENYFTTLQEWTKLDFRDYFLDLPMIDEKSEIYKQIYINGKQISTLKHQQIQDEIQQTLAQMFSPINHQRQNRQLNLQEIKDPKTGLDWKQQLQNMKNWRDHTQQENFKLILAILKRNYQYILDSNSILMQQPVSAQIYYGMLALQGAQLKKQQGWNELQVRQLQQYINSFTLNCKSNKKVLLELVGIFVGCFHYPFEICEIYQQDSYLIKIMIKLACNLNQSIFDDIDDIKYSIFQYLQLLPIDEQCLENTLRIYAGDTSLFNLIGKFNKVLYQKKVIKATDDIIMKKRSNKQIDTEEQKLKNDNQQKDIEKYYDYLAKSNQLLDSYNPNYYHKLENIDFSQLDFFKYIIQSQNDVFEYIYLMAQHLTKDIDFEIFKFRVNLNYTDSDWGAAVAFVRQLNSFYDDIINNSTESILKQDDKLIQLMTSMKLIQNQEELSLVKGITSLQPRYYKKNQDDSIIDQQYLIIKNLNLTKLDNETERNQIEKLYIGLCQNEFSFIYSAILKYNKLQAANLLSIFYMKHFNVILHFFGQKNIENYLFMEANILYHLLLFQLNTYSRTIEILAKNKQKLAYVRDQRKNIINCTYQILTKIDQLYAGKDEIGEIRGIKKKFKDLMNNPKTSNYNKNFSWSHWIISYPQLNDQLDKYIGQIDPQYQDILFQAKQFFKILMGIELHETIKQGELFSSTVVNYVDLSKIFSYPLLLNQQVDLGDLHRSYMKIFKSKMNHDQIKYINLFDKFIEIIILTQIPSANLNLLELKLKKQDDNSQNESQKQLQDDDDGEEDDDDKDDKNNDDDQDDQQEEKIQLVVKKFKKLLKDPIKSANDFDILIGNKIQLQILTIIQELIRLYKYEDQNRLTQQINQLREDLVTAQNNKQEVFAQINQLNVQYNGLEKEYDEIQFILNKLVELFSGFTISQGYSQQKVIYQRDKNKSINDLIDQMLFIKIKVQEYINTKITNTIYSQLINLSNTPIMSITDSEYQEKVLILLHVLTNQEPYNDEMKKIIQERKIYRGNKVQDVGRKQLIAFPIKTILAIFEILQFKMNGVGKLLQELNVGEQSVKFVMQNLNSMEKMGVFDQQQEFVVEEEEEDEKVQKAMELMKKVENGEASPSDLFKFVDEDQSNSISKQEYKIIAKRLGMDLSDHRVNEIFASFKKGQQNQNEETQMDNLNEREFAKAMEYLRSKNTNMSLDFLGISSGLLTIMLILIAIIMILTFVFVFLGIRAFALGGTFGAIINSFIPIAAGGSASGKVEKIDDSRRNKENIKDSVEKTQQIIQSSQL